MSVRDSGSVQPGPFATARPPHRPRLRPSVLLAVFAGGCVGGLARYAVSRAWPPTGDGFPWATLAVNLAGAAVLALLLVLVAEVLPPTTYVRPLLGTGFCGALTTFSSVVAPADRLAAHGDAALATGFVLANALGGLAAAVLGLAAGRAVARWRDDPDAGGA